MLYLFLFYFAAFCFAVCSFCKHHLGQKSIPMGFEKLQHDLIPGTGQAARRKRSQRESN